MRLSPIWLLRWIWVGFSGPPKLTPLVVEKWEKTLEEMVKDPEVLSKLKNIHSTPFYHNAEQSREFIRKEYEEVSKLFQQ